MYNPDTPFVSPPAYRTYCILVVDGGDTGEPNREVFFSIPEGDDFSNESITGLLQQIGREVVCHYDTIGMEDATASVDLIPS